MANTSNSRILSSLVHALRERIAATPSTPPNNNLSTCADDDALETKFRAVLPNLLNGYVVPSSSANEREVIAVLKLISNTARNFPGVFYHGKPSAVLPLIGRILPFFAEPAFSSRHGVIFETVGPLLSLLRTGSRDAYRTLFIDAMCAIEDILHIASLSSENSRITEATRLHLKCFHRSFSGNLSDSTCLCDLPTSNKPIDGPGILINLLGRDRWLPFATWIIKFLSKCLTEGTLYVEGLMNTSFVSAACSLLCYGDADLQMACFDFARVIGSVMSYDTVPHQNLIQSISTILGEDKEGLPVFRSSAYDSSIGGCLRAMHTSCPDDVVKLTAEDLVYIFHRSMWRTKSMELKVALCTAYIRISRTCPPHIWRPESLINVLCCPEPCILLIDCVQVALSVLGPHCVGERTDHTKLVLSTSSDKLIASPKVGEKRRIIDVDNFDIKRQKIDGAIKFSNANFPRDIKITDIISYGREGYADFMHESLLLFVETLNAPRVKNYTLRPDVALTALSLLSIAFCRYPQTNMSHSIFRQLQSWIPWICEQAKLDSAITVDISVYLEGIHSMLLIQGL